jgi:APA family basic amino acid/polyamine antiporter
MDHVRLNSIRPPHTVHAIVLYRPAKPGYFGAVHPLTRTPVNATLLVSLAVLVMALWLPIEVLAGFASLFILTVFTLVNAALWRIKLRETEPSGVFCVPMWVPVAGCLCSFAFIVYTLFSYFG